MIIELINNGPKGCFKASENGIETGHMNYKWSGCETIIIYHTRIHPEFEGKGIGRKLVMEAVKDAREKHLKIIPECPFVKSIFDNVPEISDVLDQNNPVLNK
jgi:predicted GNAT family acetyltransferase